MSEPEPQSGRDLLRTAASGGLLAVAVSVQFSIFAAQSLLALTLVLWAVVLVRDRRLPAGPRWVWPLAAYAGATLIAAVFSPDPLASLVDCKQLLLLLIVPATYDLLRGNVAAVAATSVMTAGAISAAFGIFQYSVLHYNDLGKRPPSTLGLYMTFAGLTMLVIGLALSRVLFAKDGRLWPALLLPALAVTLAVTLTRNTWVGAFLALALLLVLRDFRLLALLPLVVAIFLVAAPGGIQHRFYSIFDRQDASNVDRVAMLRAGEQIVRDHPLTGVGPNMLQREYPAYRQPDAVLKDTPHLHNVPMQIAAERGLPALAIWIWFIVALLVDLRRMWRSEEDRWLAAAGLAAVVSMLAAGMFEYNFGDSEFLMLFLLLVTLPFAAGRRTTAATA